VMIILYSCLFVYLIYFSKVLPNTWVRLREGHKALGWAFIDRLDPDDVRIAIAQLSFSWTQLSYAGIHGLSGRKTGGH